MIRPKIASQFRRKISNDRQTRQSCRADPALRARLCVDVVQPRRQGAVGRGAVSQPRRALRRASRPGGPTDVMARVITPGLHARFGQPALVVNRAGAGGNIGVVRVKQSPADGYAPLTPRPVSLSTRACSAIPATTRSRTSCRSASSARRQRDSGPTVLQRDLDRRPHCQSQG